MRTSYPPSPEFDRVVRGDADVRLARVALEIARDARPGLDVEAQLARLDALADRVLARCRPEDSPRKKVGQINWVLFVEEEFRGDSDVYYDVANSYLDEVLDRKLGIPITLSILYNDVAERAGLDLRPVGLPGHFMLRLDESTGLAFLDAFHEGQLLDRTACERRLADRSGAPIELTDDDVAPSTPRETIARLLRNLKAIHLASDDLPAALGVQRRLAAVSDDPVELRDLGSLCLRLERPGEAVDPLAAYLVARPASPDVLNVQALLTAARSILAGWN